MGGDSSAGTQSAAGMGAGRHGRTENTGRADGHRAEQRRIAAIGEEFIGYGREIRLAETRVVSRLVDGRKQACRAEFDPSYGRADAVRQNQPDGERAWGCRSTGIDGAGGADVCGKYPLE